MIEFKNFGTIIFILIVRICAIEAVTPSDPCDPITNVAARSVFRHEMKEMIEELAVLPLWYIEPLRYVNCSKRGLSRIPSTIPSNVQFLDLSSNTIGQVTAANFHKFVDLQILRLYSNCIGNSPRSQFFCSGVGIRGAYDKNTFNSLTNLKLLDIGGNAFANIPPNLPQTLEYLDFSRSGIRQITKADVAYMKKLSVLLARNTCYYCNPEGFLMIDPDAFADLPLQVVAIHENRLHTSMLSRVNFKQLIYLNVATSFITSLQSFAFENLSSVKFLDLHLLNPNVKNVHVKISNGTFDQLKYLEYLDLSCNLIDYLPDNVFQHNTRLKTLDLSGNCLGQVTFNPIFVPLQIEALRLGYNYCRKDNLNQHYAVKLGPVYRKLSKLRVLSFGKPVLLHLAALYSSSIAFRSIDEETFQAIRNLSHLKAIVMSDGLVQKVDLTTIHNLPSLDNINLYNNEITNITSGSVKLLQSITKRSENLPKCKFYELSLSNNLLKDLHASQLIHNKVTVLDLSVNLISHTGRNLFQYMPCLEFIDLKSNPIQFLHDQTFKANKRLKRLFISSTYIIGSDYSLCFLENLTNYIQVTLTFIGDNLFRLLYKAATDHDIRAHNVVKAELSKNIIPDKRYIEDGLMVFRNVKSLRLSMCRIAFTYFYLPTPSLEILDLSHNNIREITSQFLESIPRIEILLISFNEISFFRLEQFNITPKLSHLDLSHNQITNIFKARGLATFGRLKKLELQNNYIFELSADVFSLSLLSQLEYLDLRWNSIECYCELTLTVGRWLSQREYYLNDRPGFLPTCTYSLDKFGGCVTCATNERTSDSLLEQSLLQYATKNYCSNSFYTLLTICYTSFTTVFIALALFLLTNRGMLWMAKFATRRIRLTQMNNEERNASTSFAFHGFVIFDTEDNNIGNWVDNQLVPQLTENPPYMKISVINKDDHCGFAPTTQLFLKMEASKKVIVVLTKNYGLSRQGKYVLSNLEYLSYRSGVDRSVIVTFENDAQVGGLLRRRQKQADMSLLQFPDDERFSAIFWENLRHLLL